MGQKRLTIMGEETPVKEEKKKEVGAEIVEEAKEETPKKEAASAKKKTKPAKVKGKAYLGSKAKVEAKKVYGLSEAIKLLKETAYAKFTETAEIHMVANKKGLNGDVTLPHFEVKSKKIEIASDETVAKLETGKIDFDILVATPAFMPKLVKFAKLLGPKGLMPNPKNGTISPDPEKALEKFQKASFSFKTEASAPLVHSIFGKVNQKEEELEANLKALIKAVNHKNILSAIIKSSMGPAIKITVE